jgi:hypothetical protein
VIVAPRDGEFFCLLVCCNTSWFFVHIQLDSPLPLGEGLGVRANQGAEIYVKKSAAAQPTRVSS